MMGEAALTQPAVIVLAFCAAWLFIGFRLAGAIGVIVCALVLCFIYNSGVGSYKARCSVTHVPIIVAMLEGSVGVQECKR